jgi:glycosyltransferase involved in cell wall biosynthesis
MRSNKAPLISVIINCYNGEQYLKEAVRSVINQTFKKWEIIFWDNKSEDGSKEIIKSFKDKRIKYFYSKKHHKLYKARNLAIKKSKGKYICFLDVDDTWLKNKLKIQISQLLYNNFDIVFSNYFIKDENKNQKYLAIKKNKSLNYKNLAQEFLDYYFLGILTVMAKKQIFMHKKFNSKYQIIGDFDFFIKASLKYKIFYNQSPLAIYRIHSNNFSNKKIKMHINELKIWLIENKLKFRKYNTSAIKKIILRLKLKSLFFLIYNFLGV